MRILVYGAGNIGSLYAALLQESGQDVSILARGKRLKEIRSRGIWLEDALTGRETTSKVEVVARLDAQDRYDFVLVVLPKNHVSEVLPILRENRRTPNIVFFGNNAAGATEMEEALGRERVLLGFPGAAATVDHHTLRYLILAAGEQPTTLGELDGTRSARIEELGAGLEAAGFPVSICSRMDSWLKTHAAEIWPTANALYAAGGDIDRLVRTPDALVLMLRGILEGYRALTVLGIPITPANHNIFRWLPEPVLLWLAKKMLQSNGVDIKIGHALAARDEMRVLSKELQELIRTSGVEAPATEVLGRYVDPHTDPLADGSSQIPVRRKMLWFGLGLLAILAVLVSLLT
ncbi:MAG: hypothetical protein K0U98_00840 [Deltaproteobacteria bacterium]|nr:hypothetical protein [Deltaproteobacteria bacterium]